MLANRDDVDSYVPDGTVLDDALARVTHLGIGAHQDDLEIMAFHGVLSCAGSEASWFGGVTCTRGGGSPRTGAYADADDEEIAKIRVREQNEAAEIGCYSAMIQLGHGSPTLRGAGRCTLVDDLERILERTRPAVLYTHNPFDRHRSHVAVLAATVEALHRLPADTRPATVLGCEVWRGLEWLPAGRRVCLDVSGGEDLAADLLAVFRSQIRGGKRYDVAEPGRRRANATYAEPREVDAAAEVSWAVDLGPLVDDRRLTMKDFVAGVAREFVDELVDAIEESAADVRRH